MPDVGALGPRTEASFAQRHRTDGNRDELVLVAYASGVLEIPPTRLTRPRT